MDIDSQSFESTLRNKLGNEISDEDLDVIDDLLIDKLDSVDREEALICAQISVDLFTEYYRVLPLAYSLNTLIIGLVNSGDITGARLALKRLVDHSIEFDIESAGLSGVENVMGLYFGDISYDHIPYFLSETVRFYLHFNLLSEAIASLIKLAIISSDHGAFQSAYRALTEAEELCHHHKLGEELGRVLGALCATSLLEGDNSYSIKTGDMAVDLYTKLEIETPSSLLLNLATAKMQTGEQSDAIKIFEKFLEISDKDSVEKLPILINLSACYRQLGNASKAVELIVEARGILSVVDPDTINDESLAELELISSANYLMLKNFPDAVKNINSAIKYIDQMLLSVDRLHYRRGLRERYIHRIEALLCLLPENGDVSDVISIIAFTRQNQASDWIHILNWASEISSKLTLADKTELDVVLNRMANFGVPFLFGYREKYNDPFGGAALPDPWPDFSGFSAKLCSKYELRRPLSDSTMKYSTALIENRLGEGYGVLVSLLSGGMKALFLLRGKYYFCKLPKEETEGFHREISKHRQGGVINPKFNTAICKYQKALIEKFKIPLDILSGDEFNGLIFMPDSHDLIPINLVSLGFKPICSKMASGKFEVRTSIVLFEGEPISRPKENIVGLLEQSEDLRFAEAEIKSFFNILESDGELLVNPNKDLFYKKMKSAEALIVSQHGIPIRLFADPHFANMSGVDTRGVLSFDQVQQVAYQWEHRLVILGLCHSGVNMNRNYQSDFKTHEFAGFPSILLTNRKSAVVASTWSIVDRFGYFLTCIFSKEMHNTDVSKAFSIALAKLVELSDNEILQLYDYIKPDDLKETVLNETRAKPISYLTRQPACYGSYQIYTLF